MLTGDCKLDFDSGNLSQSSDCFPEEVMQDHLRPPCGSSPSTIPLPGSSAQQTANRPFLGTLVGEGTLVHDWMINEAVFKAVRFRIPAADVTNRPETPRLTPAVTRSVSRPCRQRAFAG